MQTDASLLLFKPGGANEQLKLKMLDFEQKTLYVLLCFAECPVTISAAQSLQLWRRVGAEPDLPGEETAAVTSDGGSWSLW